MNAADALALGAIIATVVTFLVGFSSVRVHAHLDRAVARYEALVDRLVDIARQTRSYPRPKDVYAIGELFAQELRLDPSAIITPWICLGVAGFDVAIIVWCGWMNATFRGVPGIERLAVYGVSAIGIVVSSLLVIDFVSVRSALRKERDSSLPKLYEQGMRLIASPDSRSDTLRLFEDILGAIPRWPWAMLPLAAMLADSQDAADIAYRKYLCAETISLVENSDDPVDRALLARAYIMTNRHELARGMLTQLEPLKTRYPEIAYLIGDTFPLALEALYQ